MHLQKIWTANSTIRHLAQATVVPLGLCLLMAQAARVCLQDRTSCKILLMFDICGPKLAEFLQGSRVPASHGWPLHHVGTTIPPLPRAIELLQQAIKEHHMHVFFHETMYHRYKFTALPRLENVVRIKEENMAQLTDIAYSPIISSLMAHPALL